MNAEVVIYIVSTIALLNTKHVDRIDLILIDYGLVDNQENKILTHVPKKHTHGYFATWAYFF